MSVDRQVKTRYRAQFIFVLLTKFRSCFCLTLENSRHKMNATNVRNCLFVFKRNEQIKKISLKMNFYRYTESMCMSCINKIVYIGSAHGLVNWLTKDLSQLCIKKEKNQATKLVDPWTDDVYNLVIENHFFVYHYFLWNLYNSLKLQMGIIQHSYIISKKWVVQGLGCLLDATICFKS